MGLYKKSGTWYIDYYVQGRRKREAIGPNKKMAQSVLAKRKTQVAEKSFLDIQKRPELLFDLLCDQYMEYAKANKRSWERDYRSIKVLKRWFSDKKLFEITPLSVEKFKSARNTEVSGASVNRELACMKHMFTKAIEWDMAAVNPVKQVKMFRENPGRIRYLSNDEIKRLIHACNDTLRPIVIVALHTGMRKQEILDLRWESLDIDQKIIYVCGTKSGHDRQIPMLEPVLFAIKSMPKRSEHIFTRPGRGRVINIRKAFEYAKKRSKIDNFTFHDLRHTFASHLVMNGTDLLTVKELLGHQTIEMTLRYSHLSPEHKRHAVESLKYFNGHYMDTQKKSIKQTST
ncbi:MAG: site-specific integrase [candidate division Zixibacteria bacterium]